MTRLLSFGARCLAGAVILLLAACGTLVPQTMALREDWPQGASPRVHIDGVPLIAQDDFQCGPAALAMAMTHAGRPVSADEMAQRSYLPARHGSLQTEMLAAPRAYGLVTYALAPRFDDLLREVSGGLPVIVFLDTGLGFLATWHYAVVVGYDYPAGELILHAGQTEEERIPFTIFEYMWRKSDYWAMVVAAPEQIPATADEDGYLSAVLALEKTGNRFATGAAYRALLQRWPDNLAAPIGLANIAYGQGQLLTAEEILRGLLDRHPDSVEALNNLAQVLSDQGRQEQALATIRKAQQLGGPFQKEVSATYRLIEQRAGKDKKDAQEDVPHMATDRARE